MTIYEPLEKEETDKWLEEALIWYVSRPPQGITELKADLITQRLIRSLQDVEYWRDQARKDHD